MEVWKYIEYYLFLVFMYYLSFQDVPMKYYKLHGISVVRTPHENKTLLRVIVGCIADLEVGDYYLEVVIF